MRTLTVLVPALLMSSCVCGGDTVVPDHRPPATPTSTPEPTALAPFSASEHPDGTRQLLLEGASVVVEAGAIRASGLFDFDRDGDRDALLVVLDGSSLRVLHAGREAGDTFVAPTELASHAVEGRCTLARAELVGLSPQIVLARGELGCDVEPSQHSLAWVISSDERPRALEVIELSGSDGETLSFEASDRDGDGHDDVAFDVRVASQGGPVSVSLPWVSRAAGLAREGNEPDATIAALSTRARERLRRDPSAARALADQAISLREALCRESERPRLHVGGAAGLPCRDAHAAGRAHAVRAAALVRELGTGPLADLDALDVAIEATLALDRGGLTVRPVDRALSHDAWSRVATTPPGAVRPYGGGEVAPVSTRAAPRLSTLGFLDEERLLVRGPSARVLRLGGEEVVIEDAPAGAEDARLLDADARLELVSIERRCEGNVLVLAPAGGVVDALTGSRREVLASPRPAPLACPPLTEALRLDDGGLVALGWAPQGIVLARGTRLVLVPLDVAGAPAGPASELGPEVPPPVPLLPGAAVADAQAHALALPFGLLVIDREARSATLYRPSGFEPPAGLAVDVALSPSRSRLAWLCGGTVCWTELRPVPVADEVDAGGGG